MMLVERSGPSTQAERFDAGPMGWDPAVSTNAPNIRAASPDVRHEMA